jgi:hypothetical protein
MIPELETYQDQLLSIKQDAEGLMSVLTEAQFNWRPAIDRWSIGECFDHLNATARLFVPAIDAAIATARAREWRSQGPFVYPLFERIFLRLSEPPPRIRFRAPGAFRPAAARSPDDVGREFMDWQEKLGERLAHADGLDLRRARHRSPAIGIFRWSLGTMFAVMLAHQRRHIWQARQVLNQPGFAGTAP